MPDRSPAHETLVRNAVAHALMPLLLYLLLPLPMPLPRSLLQPLLISLLLGGLARLQFWPGRPLPWLGCLLLLALVLPLQIVGEHMGELIFRNSPSQAVERRMQGRPFSWLRVLTGLRCCRYFSRLT